MKFTKIFIGVLSIGLVALACSTSESSSEAVLYEGARLIVGDGSGPLENAAFLV